MGGCVGWMYLFFFSSRRRHTRLQGDWSSDVCSSDLGPGQAAQKWLKNKKITTANEIQETVPIWFLEAARASYFGGWFEIMMHGMVPGITYEYDINSAYPYIISSLPCLLHGEYKGGSGKPPENSRYVLVYASLSSYRKGIPCNIGTML